MTEEDKGPDVSSSPAPTPPRRSGSWLVLAGAGLALLLLAGAAGAVISHEVWTSHGAASAVRGPSASGSGTIGVGGSTSPGGAGFGNGGFNGFPRISIGGITVGPGGVSFGNNGGATNGGSATGGPSNAAAIAAKVDPALVDVQSSLSYEGGAGAGTGIVLTSNGEVLTNNHVIEGATRITATDVGNGKTYDATVVGYDPTHDIAVIQLQGASGLATASLGDSSKLKVGQPVLGIGNAGGVGGTPSPAGGKITGLGQSVTAGDELGGHTERLTGLIETNAPIVAGDSGGPFVDGQGRVIGMTTAGTPAFGFSLGFGSGTAGAFAIPIDEASTTAAQIVGGRASSSVHVGPSAFLGVQLGSPGLGGYGLGGFGASGSSSSGSGVDIGGVLTGEPAAKAGLGAGDVITSLDGRQVGTASELSNLMLAHHPGDTVKLGWTTAAGQPHTSSIQLASGPPA
jgi:S1-C subfamily serine protease